MKILDGKGKIGLGEVLYDGKVARVGTQGTDICGDFDRQG
jgi:hypothetical protein